MEKFIYLVRHCEAEGQDSKAPLTAKGFHDSLQLVEFFKGYPIERVISSPYTRAEQTITPLAKALNKNVELDVRLQERVLSSSNLPSWQEKLEQSFEDLDLKFDGGESSREAMVRANSVIEEVYHSGANHIIIVSHGNLLALVIKYFCHSFGFEQWKNMSNPDVFQLHLNNNEAKISRLWTN
ncbi:2,3-bisphosphoglycerate-dependent phosphoglycerate mutase [Salirhabdus euzebyi]|uniref:2,3-bisphosphoglycerate-dependent phosphoglycerate mutase n=1 Tax=Salirhabdus euzebyi TaxID=394506 RepID=A0A841Q883_9BACI|nr:histidine phosphatase family protein [Salirhabdus euzebyi]MBB6454620.1 2,3-bisphosphoglycerate-dependent phosphoglycerate mutase [Salirhabdus euzebyi]